MTEKPLKSSIWCVLSVYFYSKKVVFNIFLGYKWLIRARCSIIVKLSWANLSTDIVNLSISDKNVLGSAFDCSSLGELSSTQLIQKAFTFYDCFIQELFEYKLLELKKKKKSGTESLDSNMNEVTWYASGNGSWLRLCCWSLLLRSTWLLLLQPYLFICLYSRSVIFHAWLIYNRCFLLRMSSKLLVLPLLLPYCNTGLRST